MTQVPAGDSTYLLGDSPSERERLDAQAERLRTLTERFLLDAGIVPGMRVLELGCGPGHVTRLLARWVGAGGRVVALERSPVMLAHARHDLAGQENANVCLIECDLNEPLPRLEGPFDAVVGRLILAHVRDPVGLLRGALTYLRAGGVVAFQEPDCTLADHLLATHRDQLPLVRRANQWIELAREGTMNPRTGIALYHVFRHAGLPAPTLQLHTELHGGASADRARNTVTLLRNVLPRLHPLGVEEADLDLSSLEERLLAETAAADVVQARSSIVSAWAVNQTDCPP